MPERSCWADFPPRRLTTIRQPGCFTHMSKVYSIKRVHTLPISLDHAWTFFSNPANLERLTPAYLKLKFTNELFGETMYPGQIITYRIRPVLGIPVFWMTEITHLEQHRFFVDEQRKGP